MDLSKLKIEVEKKVESIGYQLYDIEFVKEKKDDILRIMIDHDHGIDIDDCIKVSNELNPFLDILDPIPTLYHLEVCSPGAERKLRNREEVLKAVGKYIHLETYEQTLEGDLIGFEGDTITLRIKNKYIEVMYYDIQEIRLAIKF